MIITVECYSGLENSTYPDARGKLNVTWENRNTSWLSHQESCVWNTFLWNNGESESLIEKVNLNTNLPIGKVSGAASFLALVILYSTVLTEILFYNMCNTRTYLFYPLHTMDLQKYKNIANSKQHIYNIRKVKQNRKTQT